MTPPLSPGRTDLVVDNPSERDLRDAAEMAVDQAKQSDTMSQGPLRLLEDERVHLQKSGLRLSDFDVRGTLGQCCIGALPCTYSMFVQALGRSEKSCLSGIALLLQNQAPITTSR